ncbi:hypothetical protein IF2G_07424 [Cordyceps javanica]|nr:hypothetical protein IF2G_07424 [Cordyceps javanica]
MGYIGCSGPTDCCPLKRGGTSKPITSSIVTLNPFGGKGGGRLTALQPRAKQPSQITRFVDARTVFDVYSLSCIVPRASHIIYPACHGAAAQHGIARPDLAKQASSLSTRSCLLAPSIARCP